MKVASDALKGIIRLTATAGLALSLTACTVGPNYTKPDSKAPDAFREPLAGGLKNGPADLSKWWSKLNDPMLDSLVERAIAGNLSLREAEARLREARAQRGIVAADQYPQVDAVGRAGRDRASKNSNNGRLVDDSDFDRSSDLYSAGFDASWEIDVFGRVRRNIEAADADVAAAAEARRDVLISLLAEVARNYVDLRTLQLRLEIAQKNVDIQQASLDLATARAKAGLSSELDARRAESQLASIRSQIPKFEQDIRQTANRLAVLLGQQPGTLTQELTDSKPIPPLPPELPVGLPSELLRRRPDVRQAERNLAGATARIGVATADLYPRFSISAALGLESGEFNSWGDASSRYWSFVPGFKWPIFQGGRIQSNIEVQNAREQQALIRYEQTVLGALEETENSLVSYEREQTRTSDLDQSVRAERDAVSLANELYSKGLSDFSAVIDAQRQLYLLEDQLAQSRSTQTTNLIALYKALGGGWEEVYPETQPAQAKASAKPESKANAAPEAEAKAQPGQG